MVLDELHDDINYPLLIFNYFTFIQAYNSVGYNFCFWLYFNTLCGFCFSKYHYFAFLNYLIIKYFTLFSTINIIKFHFMVCACFTVRMYALGIFTFIISLWFLGTAYYATLTWLKSSRNSMPIRANKTHIITIVLSNCIFCIYFIFQRQWFLINKFHNLFFSFLSLFLFILGHNYFDELL